MKIIASSTRQSRGLSVWPASIKSAIGALGFFWVLFTVPSVGLAEPLAAFVDSDRGAGIQESGAAGFLREGLDLLDRGEGDAAIKPLRQALALYRSTGDRSGEGRALKALGNAYHSLSDYPAAVDYQRQTLELARTLGDTDLECRALINLAGLSRDQGRLDQALQRYRQALTIARQQRSPDLEAIASSGLGVVLFKQGDYAGAVETLARARELAQQTSHRGVEAASLVYLGRANEAMGRLPEAIDAYQGALPLTLELGNRGGELSILSALASAYYQDGDYAEAITHAQANLAGAEALGLSGQAVASLGLLTTSYIALGDNAKALAFALRQLEQARLIDDRSLQGVALEQVGVNHLALADYLKAIDAFSEMRTIGRQLTDFSMESKALRNLGQVYLTLGEPEMAAARFQEQLSGAIEKNADQQIHDAYQNLGDLAIQAGDAEGAIGHYQQALAAAERLTDKRWLVRSLTRLGNGYHYLGNQAVAIGYAERALALAVSQKSLWEQGRALQTLGRAHLGLGERKALDYFQQYLVLTKALNVRAEHLALNEFGSAYSALGDHAEAIEILEQGRKLAQQNEDLEGQGAALEQLATAFIALGDLSAAEAALRDAVIAWESIRAGLGTHDVFKVSVFERQAAAYQQLQQVLIARDKGGEALEVAERGRARAFVELLAKRLTPNPAETEPPPDIKQIRRAAIEHNATLVEYSILEDGPLLVWVVKPDGEFITRQVDLAQVRAEDGWSLAGLVQDGRTRLGVRGIERPAEHRLSGAGQTTGVAAPEAGQTTGVTASEVDRGTRRRLVPRAGGDAQEPLMRLHRLLIEPIEDLLPTDPNDKVIFIPQGPLFLVPFPALQRSDGGYLVERHTLSTAPSIQVLMLTGRHRGGVSEAAARQVEPGQLGPGLVVGNPTMPRLPEWSEPLPALPGAEVEAELIATLLGTRAVIGDRATKDYVLGRLGDAPLIHLATHGILDEDRGLGSAVALAPTASDAGLLTAEEILELDLKAELVVLSACNTGRGRITGDGVIGLSRSFLSAGVPSVIVSLWAVTDAPTALLMSDFYQHLKAQPNKAAALRQAMLTAMRRYPDPLSWAGFTLIGEPESISH